MAVIQNLKQSINRNVEAIMPQDDQKEEFTNALEEYYQKIAENQEQTEEFQKGIFRDFLEKVIPNKFINTSERIDLAIYNGETSKSKVGVIVEYKRLLGNESEMMSKDHLNVKALRELVAYYLRERIVNGNLEVKKGIVTNGYDFFVIDSNELEKYFYKNKKLVDLFNKFEARQLSSTKTDFLFDEVIAPAIDKALTKPIKIGYFDLRDSLKANSNEFKKQDITRLYRFFSIENLLNEMVFADSNSLNKNFYNELLYIMGLHEEKKSGNKVISRFKEGKRQDASLIENTIEQLDINDVPESKQFDIAMQLNVVWINRILFLKLLESSLVSFNHSDDYKFLNSKKITSFDDLNELFFLVMAKKVEDRRNRIREKFPYVPYMNSSLFERTELESSKEGININGLREGEIEVYSKTKLRDANGKKLTGKIQILDYLFKFLNSYDFTSAVDAKNKKSQDQLINASVLGLIFEKINGYKDGSFFTPGKITMYMAKRAVRQAVLTKVNETLKTDAKSITELGYITRDYHFSVEDRKKISDAIDELKVLDPAVGSGHFLVSVLNELIAIKASLRVLFDADGNLLNDISCTVTNDELIIQDEYGNNYSYDANKPNSLRVQKALFQQKKTIIENCLYGVDLNPNSVNICRLRLWIELLKNAYYSEDDNGHRYLTTLPNIDINIKVGDSLIHRYDLTDKFDLRKKDFKQYVELVKQYKDTSDKSIKSEINGKINSIKSTFVNSWRSPEAEKYDRALAELAGTTNLFDQKVDNEKIAELRQKVKEAKESFENRKGDPLYNNALEWRLEFPEVLDQDGNFVGFDIVIANPPYIFARNQSFDDKTKQYYLSHYEVDEYQANTYTLFMELGYNLLKKNGTFAYIVPNNMLTIQSNQKIRNFLLNKSGSLVIINSLDKIFADANVDNCLVFLKKEKSDEVTVGELNKGDFETVGTVSKDFFGKDNPILSISTVKYRDAIGAYWKVNNFESIEEKDYAQVKTGIKAYQKGKGKPKQKKSDGDNRIYHSAQKLDDTYIPYVDGNNVSRYLLTWNGEYIKYGENLAEPRKSTNFKEPRILVRQIPSKSAYSINGVFTEDTIINDLNSMVIENIKIKPLALLGIINSKIETLWFLMHFDKFQRRLFPQFKVNELAQFPVPDLNSEEQDKIADKVSVIMSKAQSKQDYSKENLEVDELVMEAYGLTEEEKQEVRDFTF